MNSKIRAGVVPALFFVTLALAAGGAGYFSKGSRANHRASAPESIQPAFVRGVVQSIAADHITLTTSTGPLDLKLPADAQFEALRPTSFDRISIGDWLNGGAIPNAQTLFALSGIVIIPTAGLAAPR